MKSSPRQSQPPDWLKPRDRAGRTHWDRRPSYREFQRDRLLRDWLGGVLAPDQMAELRGPVQTTGKLVEEVLANLDQAGALAMGRLMRQWPDLVGPDIAKASTPLRCEHGVLWVGIPNPTWRYVIESQFRTNLLDKLRKATDGEVRGIRLVPGGGAGQPAETGNRTGG